MKRKATGFIAQARRRAAEEKGGSKKDRYKRLISLFRANARYLEAFTLK